MKQKLLFYIDSMQLGGAQRVMANLVEYFADTNTNVVLVNDIYPADHASDKVELRGRIENVEKVLSESLLFLLTSDYEGLPNALMEAIAVGIPCISTDCPCGGPRELLKNAKDFQLQRCNDADGFAHAISKLLNNRDLQMECSSIEKVQAQRFKPETVLSQWKDYIINAIKALLLLSRDERARIKINIYGCTSDQLLALGISSNELSAIGDSLECFGRLPYQEVKLRIAQSDFTVLLRPNKKYANAGFPTKVGESMACGTPVIANLTSDLKLCIINGKTGIICKDETTQSCADAFRIAINMNKNERELMRQEAEKMGQGFFSIETYLSKFDQFLTKCKN